MFNRCNHVYNDYDVDWRRKEFIKTSEGWQWALSPYTNGNSLSFFVCKKCHRILWSKSFYRMPRKEKTYYEKLNRHQKKYIRQFVKAMKEPSCHLKT